MLQLTKKQVKALLDVISSDETRPILTNAKIDTFDGSPVLVATDSYKMVVLKLSDDVLPIMGHLIPRSELIKWHKLANHKDYFTEADLLPIATPDDQAMFRNDDQDKSQYPKWQKIVEGQKPEAQPSMIVNAEYMHTMQILSGVTTYNGGLNWTFHGLLAPIIARLDDNLYLVMPLKR